MNGPYLDLAPHYQRDVVWSRKAMRLLIDSMRNGYYIPPVCSMHLWAETGIGLGH